MALHLDIKNGRLTIRPADLYVAEIDAIWQYGQAGDFARAQDMLKYVFGVAEEREDLNPFAKMHYQHRASHVRRNVFGAEDFQLPEHELNMVLAAVSAYERCNSTAEGRAIAAYDMQLDMMTDLLSDPSNKPEIKQVTNTKTNEVKFVSNMDMINKTLLQMEKVSEARQKMVDRMSKATAKGKTRGQVELSASEKGLIGYNPVKAEDLEEEEGA